MSLAHSMLIINLWDSFILPQIVMFFCSDSHFVPQFPHLWNEDRNANYLIGMCVDWMNSVMSIISKRAWHRRRGLSMSGLLKNGRRGKGVPGRENSMGKEVWKSLVLYGNDPGVQSSWVGWVNKDVTGHWAGKWAGTGAGAEEQLRSQAEEGVEQRGAGLDKSRNPRGVRFM